MLKVLIVFSNPANQPRLRLDQEDKIITRLARTFENDVRVDRQHASEIDDIHRLLVNGSYDVIHFSGHGSHDGIYLEKADLREGEVVSAERLINLLEAAGRTPSLLVLLCCYAAEHLTTLVKASPFVITSLEEVDDHSCLVFIEGFYEQFFRKHSIQASFDKARNFMKVRGCNPDAVQLSRKQLVMRGGSVFVECTPTLQHDTIFVNLDAVTDKLGAFGMSEEEFCHELVRKLRVHGWIFKTPRDRAIIAIGRALFGEFTWTNAADMVRCTKIMKLKADAPQKTWQTWSQLLTSYNDLAGCEYRNVPEPANAGNKRLLHDAVRVFKYNFSRYVNSSRDAVREICADCMPHLELAITECERAEDQLEMERLSAVVVSLESALTNLHEVVDAIQPPEEKRP